MTALPPQQFASFLGTKLKSTLQASVSALGAFVSVATAYSDSTFSQDCQTICAGIFCAASSQLKI